MIRVIDNQSYDHTPNWIPLGPITIFNYLHGTLNFLGVYVNQTFNLKFYSGGGGGVIFTLINEFTCLIPKALLKRWRVMLFTIDIFITSSLILSDFITHMVYFSCPD